MKNYLKIIFTFFLLSALVFVTINQLNKAEVIEAKQGISPLPSTFTIDMPVYYMNGDALLEPEIKTLVIHGNQIVEAIMAALKEKPVGAHHFNVIDNDVRILSSEIVNQKLYLNLNKAFVESAFWKRGYWEVMLYSVVNSLTQFDTIDRVHIKIEDVDINVYIKDEQKFTDLTYNESIVYNEPATPEDVIVTFLNFVNLQRYDLAYSMVIDEDNSFNSEQNFIDEMKKYRNSKNTYTLSQPFSKRDGKNVSVVINYEYYDSVRNITYDGGSEEWKLIELSEDNYKVRWPRP